MNAATPMRQALRQQLQGAWQQRSARERGLLALAAALLLLAALWRAGLGPAWRLWQEAPQRQAALEAQTRQMQQMQAQAQQLQTPRHIEREQALRLLRDSANKLLGPGVQLAPQGDQLRLSLQAAPAAGLAQWLAQAREQALALPSQAQLQQSPRQDKATDTTWRGTLVLRLP